MAKNNELRIIEVKYESGNIKYRIDKYHIWGKYMRAWFPEISGIENYEIAKLKLDELNKSILDSTIKSTKMIQN